MKRALRLAFLTAALCLTAYPLVWMTLAAFRNDVDLLERPFDLPEQWNMENFIQVLQQGGFQNPAYNAMLMIAAFAGAALAFRIMMDLMMFRCRPWHLILPAIAAAVALALAHCPQLDRAINARPGFANAYLNSFCVTIVSVTLTLMLAAMAAFPFALCRFKGRNCLFALLIMGMMIPIHVTLIPLNLFLGPKYLALKGSLAALVGPYVGFALPISVLILTAAFKATPRDLMDAARIDGCNAWQVFRHVALPLARPALATLLIFNFLTAWNEFAFALTLADYRHPTLPLALNGFKGEHGSMDIPVICAALVIAVAPLLTVYVFAQKHIIRGLTAGAVKQ